MISFAESIQLDCPRCDTPFRAETWVVVDGHERPDLVAHILDGSLHKVACPQCGQTGDIPAPLVYHDGEKQRVLLAVPLGMPEAEWRDAGQGLLWTLVGALPDGARLPYLGDVQAEQGLGGIAQVIVREGLAGALTDDDDAEIPPLVPAIQALLAAQTPSALQHVLQAHAILRDPQAVSILRELAHAAFQQDQDEAGSGFGRAADILVELNDLVKKQPTPLSAATPKPQTPNPADDPLEELAFAVMRAHSGETLAQLVDEYPELLDPASDALLEQWATQARLTSKPRIAEGMDERRQALRELRDHYAQQRPLLEAVQALLDADTAEGVEAVIVEYDELLSLEADTMLAHLALSADDVGVRALITERRTLLQQVRTLLEG